MSSCQRPLDSRWISGSLQEASNGNLDTDARATTVADDFAYFGNQVPAVFYHLGATKPGVDLATAPPNHSPKFDADEAALEVGVRAHVLTALNYLNENP